MDKVVHYAPGMVRNFDAWLCGGPAYIHELGSTKTDEVTCPGCIANMVPPKRKTECAGCEDNFYNGCNPYGIKECWSYEGATMKLRKKVGMNDVPPWNWSPVYRMSCYHKKGYVFVDGDRTC